MNLVGKPPGSDRNAREIGHIMAGRDALSIWALVKGQKEKFPLIHGIATSEYGPAFGIDASALLNEIANLRREVEFARETMDFRTRFAESVEEMEGLSSLKWEGLSPEAALFGLVRLREFLEEIVRRGWHVENSPD